MVKNIQLCTKVAKILQTRAPILVLGSVLLGIPDDHEGHITHTLKGVHLVGHRGRFRTARAQRVHSASYYGVYPGNSPENLPPLEACMSNSKLRNSNVFKRVVFSELSNVQNNAM